MTSPRHKYVQFYILTSKYRTGCIHLVTACGMECIDIPIPYSIILDSAQNNSAHIRTFRHVDKRGHSSGFYVDIEKDQTMNCSYCNLLILTAREISILDSAIRLAGYDGIISCLTSFGFHEKRTDRHDPNHFKNC